MRPERLKRAPPLPIPRRMTFVDRLMPELASAGRRTRVAVRAAGTAMLAALAGEVALTAVGAAGSGTVAYAVVLALGFLSMMTVLVLRAATAATDRRVWLALAFAAGTWMAGTICESTVGHADGAAIGPADALWLAFYPCAYLAVVLRARTTLHRLARSLRLDGLIGVLAVGAVGWLLLVDPILASARLTHAETAVNAAYVTGDIGVMGLVVGVLALHGWRAGRGWGMLAAGLAVFAAGDSLYLVQLVDGTYVEGTPLDVLWAAGLLLMALSAWQPPAVKRPAAPTLAVLAPPFAFALAALGVLVYGGLQRAPASSIVLAAGAALASMGRTALTVADIRRLAEVRRQATTDDLTGLPNRRHLDRVAARATSRSPGSAARRSRCCSSTSTASRSSTTRSATAPATSCSSRSARGCARCCAPATSSPASAGTSSPSSCPTRPTPSRSAGGCARRSRPA